MRTFCKGLTRVRDKKRGNFGSNSLLLLLLLCFCCCVCCVLCVAAVLQSERFCQQTLSMNWRSPVATPRSSKPGVRSTSGPRQHSKNFVPSKAPTSHPENLKNDANAAFRAYPKIGVASLDSHLPISSAASCSCRRHYPNTPNGFTDLVIRTLDFPRSQLCNLQPTTRAYLRDECILLRWSVHIEARDSGVVKKGSQ